MVLARQQRAERIERFPLDTFSQFLRPPGLANQAFGPFTITFCEQRPRQSKAALGARRLIADETMYRRGVAALLPKARFRPPAQLAHARPDRIIGVVGLLAAVIRCADRLMCEAPLDMP